MREYTKEELIEKLKGIYIKNHRTPTQKYIQHQKNMPSPKIFIKAFGSWEQALNAADIPLNKYSRRYSKKELLENLRKLKQAVHRVPHSTDLKNVEHLPSATTYFRRFKSWEQALIDAKVIPKQTTLKEYELKQ